MSSSQTTGNQAARFRIPHEVTFPSNIEVPLEIPDAWELDQAIAAASSHVLSQRHADGYWWYTLEANDAINAETVFLIHYLGLNDVATVQAICRWLVFNQNADGSWALYNGGPGDVSATVECYLALKMSGLSVDEPVLAKARAFIQDHGGIAKVRVFTRIHLAMLGLIDWSACPQMPISFIQFPKRSPVNIYEFSSWARASIVPLLVILDYKNTVKIPGLDLDELYMPGENRSLVWRHKPQSGMVSIEYFFIQFDKILQIAEKLKVKPLRQTSIRKCVEYIKEHLQSTEDIFPAMFYGAIALKNAGYNLDDETLAKAIKGLNSFRLKVNISDEYNDKSEAVLDVPFKSLSGAGVEIQTAQYQQCCISPVWDTAWAGVALLEAGLSPMDRRILQTSRWLIQKQITDVYGDWAIKNPGVKPGGWSFEFENKHYPDVDDSIEILTFLHRSGLPYHELRACFERGLEWILSMQCRNGGFAAFDKNNDLTLLNKIPFADHGACLDPPTADITGRMLEFLVSELSFDVHDHRLKRMADFILSEQSRDGSFWGRWGVNYIYGTWCALGGLCALRRPQDEAAIRRALKWLKSVQNRDGGFGESVASYVAKHYVALPASVPSQTAWGLMAYVAGGLANTDEARSAADFLIRSQREDGGWDESAHTGTGFPGHFYIRYHGYRYYFPLLALARYRKASSN